jgi:hypothetical protein
MPERTPREGLGLRLGVSSLAARRLQPFQWKVCIAVCGALAQLGERLICIQKVIGSIPIGSTIRSGFGGAGSEASAERLKGR